MKTIKEIEIRTRRIPVAREESAIYDVPIIHPEAAAIVARAALSGRDMEAFIAIPLDAKNKPLGYHVVAVGGPDACPVDPRVAFRAAIQMGAAGLVVAHNHPSGDCSPSKSDDAITKRLISGANILGLGLIDHLVIGDNDHYSFRANQPQLFSEAS